MNANMLACAAVVALVALSPMVVGAAPPVLAPLPLVKGQAKELGAVRWERGYDAAAAKARASGKPLLVLFDEVPGCHTCVSFGADVLTDALLVEAAETLFTPVAVFNNIAGEDAKTLEMFREPAWNNPVVRVVDPKSNKDIGARVGDDYSVASVAASMAEGLRARKAEVPGYLDLLAATPVKTEKAVFAMFCFWEGEAKLGGLDGVVATSAGFLEGKECVEVEFDPARLNFKDLVKAAKKMDCMHAVFTTTDAQQTAASAVVGTLARRAITSMKPSADDTKYRLARSAYRDVPMTPTQASRVNAALSGDSDPERWLSPRQIERRVSR
jgi:hypothetical protein